MFGILIIVGGKGQPGEPFKSMCPFSERALKYWLANFRLNGMVGLENKSTRPKSQLNGDAD